jgi:hypothetical protein
MQPPANGTDERLDALIDEIKALRVTLDRQAPVAPPAPDGQVALREPAPPHGSARRYQPPRKQGRR